MSRRLCDLLWLLPLAGLALVIAPTAHAFTLYTTCQPAADGTPAPANCKPLPLRWFQRPQLTYRIATTAPEELALDALPALTQAAFDTWTDTFCELVPSVTYAGMVATETASAPRDIGSAPDNVVVFVRSEAAWKALGNQPSWIAITKISHNSDTGEIVDADILVNDGGYKFTASENVRPGEVDFLAMFTHEAGHFFGLDHSTEPTSTMFATYASKVAAAKDAETLASDDALGICTLYTNDPVHVARSADGGCAASGGVENGWGIGIGALWALWRARSRCGFGPRCPRPG